MPLALPAAVWIAGSLLAGIVLGIRARCRCATLAGIAALAMHLGWSCGYWTGRLRR